MSFFPALFHRLRALGYVVFDRSAYNLNIVGIRSENRTIDEFDDQIHVLCKDEYDEWSDHFWPATTDPGRYWMANPSRKEGTAVLAPGQYRGAYQLGLHRGVSLALVQVKPVRVYRDADRDLTLDMQPETIQEGMFGINIHRAGADSVRVDRWSAGCQVFKRDADFEEFLALCRRQADKGEGWQRFTYTLVDEGAVNA